ncbi:hypothetical protein [Flavilitoribacter nigricans]|uniref:hypothetical protein n=1 Tax=Flavilitoribacter nigricans TaxID=70997 RepID=UPI0014750823|nr:hypothetical protein [Flavilitoribacter nigricans]
MQDFWQAVFHLWSPWEPEGEEVPEIEEEQIWEETDEEAWEEPAAELEEEIWWFEL